MKLNKSGFISVEAVIIFGIIIIGGTLGINTMVKNNNKVSVKRDTVINETIANINKPLLDGSGVNGGNQASEIKDFGLYQENGTFVKFEELVENDYLYIDENNILYGGANKFSITGELYIPNDKNIKEIGESAFRQCTNLTKVSIPDGVELINSSAFAATKIKEITFPSSVKEICEFSFGHCYELISIHIPSTLTKISSRAFNDCDNIIEITVDDNNPVYEDRNSHAIIQKSNNSLVVGCQSTIIPSTVTSIQNAAFGYLDGFEKINIPDNIEYISTYAFEHCINATELKLPNNIKK